MWKISGKVQKNFGKWKTHSFSLNGKNSKQVKDFIPERRVFFIEKRSKPRKIALIIEGSGEFELERGANWTNRKQSQTETSEGGVTVAIAEWWFQLHLKCQKVVWGIIEQIDLWSRRT